jgi:hypothetical protein
MPLPSNYILDMSIPLIIILHIFFKLSYLQKIEKVLNKL